MLLSMPPCYTLFERNLTPLPYAAPTSTMLLSMPLCYTLSERNLTPLPRAAPPNVTAHSLESSPRPPVKHAPTYRSPPHRTLRNGGCAHLSLARYHTAP